VLGENIKMHFSLQNKPKNVFKNPWVIVGLLILIIAAFAIAYAYEGMAGIYAMLFVVVSATIAILIKSVGKTGLPEFDTDDRGVTVNGKLYPWSGIKYYSWYGEKQSERIGMVGLSKLQYDPINPYQFAKTQILELHMGVGRNLKLQIDSSQKQNLTSILNQYGVKHISLLRKIVGY